VRDESARQKNGGDNIIDGMVDRLSLLVIFQVCRDLEA
jgi:hypothetical protein